MRVEISKRVLGLLLVLLLLSGAVFSIGGVDRRRELRDIDEAAWIFNGYFFNLYVSGDWDNEYWNEFDVYANHPHMGSYLFGALMNSIGEPVTSVEPRRFWFKYDLDIVNFPEKFLSALDEMFTHRQLLAGRYMSAVFGWLAAVLVMLLVWRLAGPLAGMSSYVLLLIHPAFWDVQMLASVDTFMMALSAAMVLFSYELGRRSSRTSPASLLFCVALAVTLGMLFSTKISNFALLPAAAMAAAAGAPDRRSLVRAFAAVSISFVGALLIAWVLDPGLHSDPLGVLMSRAKWRLFRIEIQKMVFLTQVHASFAHRIAFAAYVVFFSTPFACAVAGLCAFGFLHRLLLDRGSSSKAGESLIVALAVYSSFLSLTMLPLAWVHYVVPSLLFIAALGGLGVKNFWGRVTRWRAMSTVDKAAFSASVLIIAAAVFSMSHLFAARHWYAPAPTSDEQRLIARKFAYSIIHPGVDLEVHRELLEHFEYAGNRKWADYQRSWIKRMEGQHDEKEK